MKKISFYIKFKIKVKGSSVHSKMKNDEEKKFNMHFDSLYCYKNQNKIQIGIF